MTGRNAAPPPERPHDGAVAPVARFGTDPRPALTANVAAENVVNLSLQLQGLGYFQRGASTLADNVRAFQRDESLPMVGVAGPQTKLALSAAIERSQTLVLLNARPEVHTVILESHHLRPRPARYVLHGPRGLLYRGDDAAVLTEQLRIESARVSGGLYVDLSSYPRDRVDGLMATVRVADSVQSSSTRLRFVTSRDGLNALRPGVRVERVLEARETNDGIAVPIEFLSKTSAVPRGQPMRLTVWAATMELLSEFVRMLLSLFEGGATPGMFDGSLAEAVARAKGELAKREKLSASELGERLRTGLAGVDIGRLGAVTADIASE